MNEFAITIVGGGPAGIATAIFLHALAPELAKRTIIVDKARHPREKICAGAIGARADRLLESIDVRIDVPSQVIRGFAVRTKDGELAVRGDSVVGRVVRRSEFDAALANEVRQRGIALQEGSAVRSIRVQDDGVETILESGRSIRSDVVVGADGVGSVVRRHFGERRGALTAQVIEVDTERADDDFEKDVLLFDLSDPMLRGYSWDFPTPLEGRTRMSRGSYQLRDQRRDSRSDVASVLLRRTKNHTLVGREKRFAERGLDLHSPLAWRRVVLVGEAAGIDPVLGEGIAQAISYGALAANYLAPRLRSESFAFDDWSKNVGRSKLGLDLRMRRALIPFVYGSGRGLLEQWVSSSHALARTGLRLFGGQQIGLPTLGKASLDLVLAAFKSAGFSRFRSSAYERAERPKTAVTRFD